MQEDISSLFSFLTKEKEGRIISITIIFVLLLVVGLVLFNYFFFSSFVSSENFLFHRELSRVVILEGQDPYEKQTITRITTFVQNQVPGFYNDDYQFTSPLYLLFLYLPFALIEDFSFSITVWLLLNQLLLIVCIQLSLKLFNWNPGKIQSVFITTICFISYYSLMSFVFAEFSIIQMLFFILGLRSMVLDNEIESGIFWGLASIALKNLLLPSLLIIAIIFYRGKFTIFLWSLITVIVLSLTGFIFDATWPIKMMRNAFIENLSHINNYSINISNIFGRNAGGILQFLPLLLIFWMILEWGYNKKRTTEQFLWIICLSFCINVLFSPGNAYFASVFLNIVVVYIIYLWKFRKRIGHQLIIPVMAIINILVPSYRNYLFFISNQVLNIESIYLAGVVFLIFMLYWVRWWVMEKENIEEIDFVQKSN